MNNADTHVSDNGNPGKGDGGVTHHDALGAPDDAPASAVEKSTGCGKAVTGTSTYVRSTIQIRNASREVYTYVPKTYDANRAYPIVFKWHGAGGDGLSGGLEVETVAKEDAIIVSPSATNGALWDLTADGVDVELFDKLLAMFEATTCIDQHQVFSYGFSRGAVMSLVLGCARGDVVRGIVSIEGGYVAIDGPTSPPATCVGHPGAWLVQGSNDTTVTPDFGRAARDLFLMQDNCGTTTKPVDPSPCVAYQGCATGAPVDWCYTSSNHNPQSAFALPGGWAFFQSLK